jgi:F-type H+-transporting ATPase subunit b
VLRAVVTYGSTGPEVFLSEGGEEGHSSYTYADCSIIPEGKSPTGEIESLEECDPGPSPIMPETKELYWGAGAFIVFALLMRFFLYPRLRSSMDARYESIRSAHAEADQARADARSEVAAYDAALADVKAEAAARIEAARATLEAERGSQLAEANARIAGRRETAAAQAAAAHDAARGDIGTAIATVASRTVELATGVSPDPVAVSRVVDEVMSTGVAS